MDFKNSIDVMQAIVTELTEGALVHRLQGQIFKSQGLEKLGQKYIDHFTEEMEWVEKCANRMLDLGHMPQAQDMKGRTLIEDA
ncbi:MAG: hypothetical protein IJ764_03820, partial [Bacteroidales bacterium]|nr:hypothetical protein [Bacteroidales bacterium]